MATHRIEIKFAAETDHDELTRARILASAGVHNAMIELEKALSDAGLPVKAEAHVIRLSPRAKKPALRHAAE